MTIRHLRSLPPNWEPDPEEEKRLTQEMIQRYQKRPKRVRRPQRQRVWEKSHGQCWYCGRPLDFQTFHTDHITPRHAGGTNALCNLAPSCDDCNRHKNDKTLDEFRRYNLSVTYTDLWGNLATQVIREAGTPFWFEHNLPH